MAQAQKPSTKDSIRSFIFWFATFYLIFYFFTAWFGPDKKAETEVTPVMVTIQDKTIKLGNLAEFTIQNRTDQALAFTSPCEGGESASQIGIYGIIAGNRTDNLLPLENCSTADIPSFEIPPGAKYGLSFRSLSNEIFKDEGNYILELELQGEEAQTVASPTFEYSEPGIFRKLYRALIAKPLFNTLVFFIKILPSHSLGWAIILLTILVRIILFVPNQNAMKSQREMQKMQPKIQEIRAKHKDNPQLMAMKTMEIYKTHNIHPLGSMMPMLVQFPVLIGMYLIIQQGVSPHQNHLLYSFNQSIDLSLVENLFLWFDVSRPDPLYILPVLVAGIQFLTMKLAFAKSDKKKKEAASDKPAKKKSDEPNMADMAEQMQKTMLYVMPVMIGVFTIMFPAGVGLYWFVSTLIGTAQQKLVNWTLDRPQVTRVEK